MTDEEIEAFARKRVEVLKERIKLDKEPSAMLQERLSIYEDMLEMDA